MLQPKVGSDPCAEYFAKQSGCCLYSSGAMNSVMFCVRCSGCCGCVPVFAMRGFRSPREPAAWRISDSPVRSSRHTCKAVLSAAIVGRMPICATCASPAESNRCRPQCAVKGRAINQGIASVPAFVVSNQPSKPLTGWSDRTMWPRRTKRVLPLLCTAVRIKGGCVWQWR